MRSTWWTRRLVSWVEMCTVQRSAKRRRAQRCGPGWERLEERLLLAAPVANNDAYRVDQNTSLVANTVPFFNFNISIRSRGVDTTKTIIVDPDNGPIHPYNRVDFGSGTLTQISGFQPQGIISPTGYTFSFGDTANTSGAGAPALHLQSFTSLSGSTRYTYGPNSGDNNTFQVFLNGTATLHATLDTFTFVTNTTTGRTTGSGSIVIDSTIQSPCFNMINDFTNGSLRLKITVNDVDSTQAANSDPITFTATGRVSAGEGSGVLANDADADRDPLTAAVVSQPTNGTVTMQSDGSFTYTPTTDYTGPDSFTYRANDGTNNSNTATVNITVNSGATMFRAYNPNADYHFFTTSKAEFDNAVNAGYRDETYLRAGFSVPPTQLSGTTTIFRLYNIQTGRHYYTYSAGERDSLVNIVPPPASGPDTRTVGWRYEKNEGFIYSDQATGTTEIFRLYNNNSGVHLYTENAAVKDSVLAITDSSTGTHPWVKHSSFGFAFGRPLGRDQLLAEEVAAGDAVAAALTPEQLQPIVQQAIVIWAGSGLTADQATRLNATEVRVGNLSGATLGVALPGLIYVDTDAAGFGWFVDSTPGDNAEFGALSSRGLTAGANSPAAGRMDLLTVVVHELGHVLGLDDLAPTAPSASVMTGSLVAGVRRLPAGAADAVFASGDFD